MTPQRRPYLGVKNTGFGAFLVNWYGGVVLAADARNAV
jgi:hypothetical protein